MSLLRYTHIRRWVIVALVLLSAAMLGEVAVQESARTPELGVELAWQDDSLIVARVNLASLAWMDGIEVGDRVELVNGASPRELTPDQGLTSLMVVNAAGEHLTTTVPTPASSFVVPGFMIAAALFLIVGSVVYIVAAQWVPSTIVLGLTVSTALLFLGPIAGLSGQPWASVLTFVALIGFGATVFLVSLVVPVDRLKSRPGQVSAVMCLVMASLLIGLYVMSVMSGAAYKPVRTLVLASVGASLLLATVIGVLGFVRPLAHSRSSRRTAVQLGLGAAGGLLPFCSLSLLPSALGHGYFVPPELSILSVVLIPVALGGALLSRDFPGVERLVNRGLVALVVWCGLFGAFAGVVHAVSDLMLIKGSAAPDLVLTINLAVSLATFPVLQAWLRRQVERTLFRDLYDPADLVRRIGDDLVRLHGLTAVTDRALERIVGALDLRWAALSLHGDPTSAGPRVWGDAPRGVPASVTLQLVADSDTIGTLALGPKRSDIELQASDYTFLDTVRPLLATAVQNEVLFERLEAQVDALAERERALAALNARFIGVHEEERRALALDLHDDALQRVVLLSRDLSDDPAVSPERLEDSVERWRESASDIAIALRAVCRDLRPPMLDDLGLGAALQWLASETRSKSDLEIVTQIEDVGRVDPGLAIGLYRIAQEGLNNVRKHAEASSVVVALSRTDTCLRLSLADNGRGISQIVPREGQPTSLGLLGMRERVAPWRGSIQITPGRFGGTIVLAEVPLEAAELTPEPLAA